MKILTFSFDGHQYHINNADDWQDGPEVGDVVFDAHGNVVCFIGRDTSQEYVVVEGDEDELPAVSHENEPSAVWNAFTAFVSGTY